PWHGEWMAKIVHAVAPDARIIPINARTLTQRDYQTSVLRLAPPAYFSTGREGNIPTVGSEPQDIQPSSRAWSGTRLASCVKAVRLHDAIIALHLLNRYSAKERKHWSHVAA
ncbi:MAG: hypothetical protein WD227_15965, partial [Vicinamibacterales bacterium]